MARVWDASELSLDPIRSRAVAVVGYGNQGRAQALNLRDRGVEVLVGNRDDAYAELARADGMTVLPVGAAVGRGDVVLFLVPDEVQPDVYRAEVEPALRSGQTLGFASGYNVAYGFLSPAPGADLVMVAPRMIGRSMRELFVEGRGFPVLVGVERDESGRALETALSIAAAIGAGLPGGCAVESSFREEATLDLFSEHTWAPATVFILKAACEVLIQAGVSPEAAILEVYGSGEIGEIGRAMAGLGLAGQMRLHSHTSQFGHLLWGPRYDTPQLRSLMAEALARIQDGSFARRWQSEQAGGLVEFEERWRRLLDHPLFGHEERLYRRLGRVPSRAAATGPTTQP
ncbi:MAG TPA: NAD(P)-binding domain-containing protein [Candidatus Dormibacteraeota bacterium]|nr:NAD(P)-binding domain-containing protein [Candidatus Dormibacteraeota bacterium]